LLEDEVDNLRGVLDEQGDKNVETHRNVAKVKGMGDLFK